MRTCFKMAAPAMFVRLNAVCEGSPVLFRRGCLHRFVLRKRPVLLEVHRCLCLPSIDTELINQDIQEQERPVELRESDPANHTEANIGQYYTVPDDVTKTVVSSLLTKKFLISECKMAGNTNLMVRQPALDVIKHLKGLPQHAEPPKFIFYGLDGCGKSLSLAHVVHYCYLAGWFILLVPSVFKWVHGASELQISTYHTERFDQPAKAVAWLQFCRSINGQFFSQLKTSQKYLWGKRDNTLEGEPLSKVVDQGLQRINFATDAVGVILKEIKHHPSLRVLYAVDEFNGFFQKTSFMDPKQKFIKPNRLGLIHHFTELLDPVEGLKRGAMAFALSRTGMQRSRIKSCLTADLLGPKGLSEVKDFIDVHVPPYSPEELDCCLQFYKKRGILTKGLNPGLIKEIAFVSNYEPRRVSAVVMPH